MTSLSPHEWFQAAEEIEWFARKMSGLMAVAGELKRIGSLEQAAAEASRRFTAASHEDAATAKALSDKKGSVEAAMAAYDQKLAELEARAAERESQVHAIAAQAEGQRDSIISQAKKDAEDILAEATKKAKSMKRATEDAADIAREQTDIANAALKALEKEIEGLRVERDKVKDEIASLKKRLG